MVLKIVVPIPDKIADQMQKSFACYPDHLKEIVPRQHWHITLASLAEFDNKAVNYQLLQPLLQSFVPIIRLTHIGLNNDYRQLWAYAEPSAALAHLSKQVYKRLAALSLSSSVPDLNADLRPHVLLATLHESTQLATMADYPLLTSFAPKNLSIIKQTTSENSAAFTIEAAISLLAQ